MPKTLIATGSRTLSESLAFADVEELEPADDEAVVAVEAFSVNRGEAMILNGAYGVAAEAGRRLGQDVAGRVIRAAADGSGPAVGSRVVGHPEGGGWAEEVAVPTSKLAVLPDAVGSVTAAALPLAGLTALRLVRLAGTVVGKRALLTGAGGGVGHYLVELLAGAGAEVVAVTSDAERGARLRELGAAEVVKGAAEARGEFELIFEGVGGAEFGAALAKGGGGVTVLWYGQASLEAVSIDFFRTIPQTPFTVKHFPHWVSETSDGEDLATLVRLVAEGRLHPEVGVVADWAETGWVLEELYGRRVSGNAVLGVS